MDSRLIECGKIINTHGIKGEVKIEPWADSPGFKKKNKSFYINGTEHKVISSRVHQKFVIARLSGIDSINDAEKYKNKIIYALRSEAALEEGQYFLSDLIGFDAFSADNGTALGKVTDIISLPAGDVCVIRGEREILVPIREEFIKERSMDEKRITVRLLEGM